MFKILLLSIFLLTSSFSANNLGDKKVKLLGNKKDSVSKRIKIKDIEKVGYVDFIVEDPHLFKKNKFGGVLLKDFVEFYGKKDVSSLTFVAIDNYKIVLKKEQWENDIILLSTKLNGKYVNFDEKGPLRIIFPNYNPEIKKYSKNLVDWIWMIKSIEFK